MPQAEVLLYQAYDALVRQKAQLVAALHEVEERIAVLAPLVVARPEPTDRSGRKPTRMLAVKEAILTVLALRGMGRGELMKEVGATEKTFMRALDELMAEGQVSRVSHGYYALTPTPDPAPLTPTPPPPVLTEQPPLGDGSPERPFQINPGV